MSLVDPDLNNGPTATLQTVKDEALTATPDTSSVTKSPSSSLADFATGVADSVTDHDIITQQLVDSIPDISLTSGVNIDNVFSLGGFSPFSGDPLSELTNVFGSGFSFDDIADQFGVSGLLGNLPINIDFNIAPKLDPTANVLHGYASHTYKITMGAQSISEHNEITDAGFTTGSPKITSLMMASGGDHKVDDTCRDPIFKEDFYLEDLRMHTIIGSNAQGNGSNSVGLEFTIVEPYAVSLIERLLALSAKLGYENYIEIPYVFKIEFVGYDDEGNSLGIIPQTTRYIPFRLTYMRLEIKGQGSLYECTAIPVNHFAFNQTIAAIPQSLEIAAGSVGEFFNGKPETNPHQNTVGSVVDTINGFHNNLVATGGVDAQTNSARDVADKINIEVHPSIAIHNLQVANLSKLSMLKEGFAGNAHMDPKKPTYGFNAGTSITSIIEQIIKSSTFHLNQIEEAERIDKANNLAAGAAARNNTGTAQVIKKKPFIDFKITSAYKMLDYDVKANRHAYEATFIVAPYEKRAVQSALMGRSEVENVAKEYDYLFTGQNQDILDLTLNFDLAFYNSLDANTESAGEAAQASTTKPVTGDDTGDNQSNNCDPINKVPVEHQQASAKENTGTAAKEDRKKLKAAAFRKSIMQSSTGDMVTFDMNILGDPAFIKQDDILYRADGDIHNPFTDNGAIKQDTSDMYIRLRFKVFDDIDHETGLRVEGRQIPGSAFARKSTFDGFYRVMQLENVFSEGRFTQNLVVMRTYVQEDCDPESDAATNLTSNLVGFANDKVEQAKEAGLDKLDAFGGPGPAVSAVLSSGTNSACSPLNNVLSSAQAYAEDIIATGADRVSSAFEQKEEDLTPAPDVEQPTAETITEITNTRPVNADRRR